MTFQLDNSGSVKSPKYPKESLSWDDLTPFERGYIEALPWTALGEERIAKRLPLRRPAFRDLAPETLARIIADCQAFGAAYGGEKRDADTGAKLWRLRQDEWPGTDFKHAFPPLTVQLGDDGKVRFAP